MTETLLNSFVSQVITNSPFEEVDRIYLSNRVMALVGEEGLEVASTRQRLVDLKDQLVDLAVANAKCGELPEEKDIIGAQLMDLITPAPSRVNRDFWESYAQNPEEAIANFYHLSKANDYIKVKAISKNIYYQTPTDYGDLEITINLSKPEKDPKAIAAAKLVKSSAYPKCQLCMENEGYQGRVNHPARANHRVIRFQMEGQTWGFQYSPYTYFEEHCIFFYGQHEPMKISPSTFVRLLDIVDLFPGYFAGSNADLPIVGGSILTHEHYQGGRHIFPMEKAPLEQTFRISGFEDVQVGIVKWPMSVIRISSSEKSRLVELASKILSDWQGYSDPDAGILAQSNGQPHHTITPIARKKNGVFELDLVLRDNQTSEEFPDGIYHPHTDVQHIKKENIGLIEVMGLAILPPRLKEELETVEDFLLGKVDKVADYHQKWADQLKVSHSISEENVQTIVQDAVGKVFGRVLEDAGVYKRTPQGQAAFVRFMESLGLEK